MSSVNKVIIVGNLGKNPETKFTPSGMQITKYSIATTESFKKGEEWEDKTEWHNIVCFNKTAKYATDYLKKGMQVYVEGRLQTSSWDDDNNQKRYRTEIIASNQKILSKKSETQGNTQESNNSQTNSGHEDSLPF